MDRYQPREAFLVSLDKVLDTFGPNVRTVPYELQKSFGLAGEDVPEKPELSVNTIEKIFGVGARVVGLAIRTEPEVSSGIKGLSNEDLLIAMRRAYHAQLEEHN